MFGGVSQVQKDVEGEVGGEGSLTLVLKRWGGEPRGRGRGQAGCRRRGKVGVGCYMGRPSWRQGWLNRPLGTLLLMLSASVLCGSGCWCNPAVL